MAEQAPGLPHRPHPQARTGPYQKVMGYEVVQLADGRSAVWLQVEPRHLNQFGIGHGGVALALLDVAGGLAVWDHCQPPRMATASMNTAFLEAVLPGPVYGVGRLERAGTTLAYTAMSLHAEAPDGRLLASGQGIYRLFTGESR